MLITTQATFNQEVLVSYYENVQSPLIIGLDDLTLGPKAQRTLKKIKPSGVILMGNNISNYNQTKSLIKDIKGYGKNLGINIRIYVDEEGGIVSRFKNLENYPTNSGITNFSKTKSTHQAKYLKEIGVDINLAPVADIAYSPNSTMALRSAGNSVSEVSSAISSYVKIMQNEGIETTLKHFPGHGRAILDSHYGLPIINTDYETWLETDAVPFIKGIEKGSKYVMFGHLIYPEIDTSISTFSNNWVKILREDLRFIGEILTDDLKMGSVELSKVEKICTKRYEVGEENSYAIKIKKSKLAGINLPLLILNEQEMRNVFIKWLQIERECV